MKKFQLNNLISLKNKASIEKGFVELLNNVKTLKIIQFLYKEGFIQTYYCLDKKIFVYIRYYNENSFFNNIKIISKPSQKTFVSYKNLCYLLKSNKIFLFSTDKGLYSQIECIKNQKGGKLLFIL